MEKNAAVEQDLHVVPCAWSCSVPMPGSTVLVHMVAFLFVSVSWIF